MKTVNALEIRSQLGHILEVLEKQREPILISKGKKIKGVLITPEDFQRRFIDVQTEEKKRELLENIKKLSLSKSNEKEESLEALRRLRGYDLHS